MSTLPATAALAVYHEHPDWFRPLFAALDRRGVPTVRLDARATIFDPTDDTPLPYGTLFNRMSPSAYLRGAGHALFATLPFLAWAESRGVRVVNGSAAYAMELSKARQLTLMHTLGVPTPRSRVISHPSQAPLAAEGLRFPVVVKANVGGSGAGIVRYDTPAALKAAVAEGTVDLGVDSTALVQEFVPRRGGFITRVETLGGRYLYAINVHSSGDEFNLCPADACQTTGGQPLARNACPVDAPQNGLRVESVTPPASVIESVERTVQAAGIDVGGIEYMIDDRDGGSVFYDVNALSNFVADAVNVVGFDPHERLVDFLVG